MEPLTMMALGTMGAGALGSLYGMLKPDPKTPSLADVDLARDNPDLWKQLQQLQSMNRELDTMYRTRRAGATASELAQLGAGRSQLSDQLATRGLVGSSAGSQQQAAAEAQMQAAIQQRAYQEMMQLMQARQQAEQQYTQNFSNAQQQALASKFPGYQAQMQNNAERNQFYGGLFGAGMNMYGTQQYLDGMPKTPIPTGAQPMATQASFNVAPSGGGYATPSYNLGFNSQLYPQRTPAGGW